MFECIQLHESPFAVKLLYYFINYKFSKIQRLYNINKRYIQSSIEICFEKLRFNLF